MPRRITVGVVGCGYWGPNLVRNFHGIGDCRLRVVCDRDRKRLKHVCSLYPGVEPERDFEALLLPRRVQAVVIATPVHTHYALAKAALQAGKHVMIEKPMAASSSQCEELVALARRRKRTLMVGHTFLYSPAVKKIKEIVASGEIGDIQYISSRRLNLGLFQKDINVVWDLAPHDLSIICDLMGEWPCGVNCQGNANVTPGVEDVANLTLSFPAGGYATVQSSWLDPRKVREMTIVGTKKMIVYDDIEPLQKIRIYDQHVTVPAYYDTFAEFTYSYHYGDMHAPRVVQEEPLKTECQHFIDCIRNRTRPTTCGEQGLALVRILESADESLRQGGARIELGLSAEATGST